MYAPQTQKFRSERDTFGELQVPADVYWGAQTQRYVPPRPNPFHADMFSALL